ncbi:hypothetical protein MNV49_005270 [Pseudohyphozyma bogoriensis]|nr:hypothetical protein MNV49_005270 [Pseudohyphozyma bogoriensis]
MAAPRLIAQVVIIGSQIVGKAFVSAWRQAARNARATPVEGGSAGAARGGDALSRNHRMTLDEAQQILNVKNVVKEESELQQMLKNFDHLFAANAPLKEGKPHSSHYLQSKIVRAKERIEAEMFTGGKKGAEAMAEAPEAATKP